MTPPIVPLETRFWSKVKKTSTCWLWTGAKSGWHLSLYGQIRGEWNGKKHRRLMAHRVAWELTNGPIPKGKRVLHRCDNTSCVNPSHLFLGTQQDNVDDMISKKRDREGMWVTDEEKRNMIADWSTTNMTVFDLVNKYQHCYATIESILTANFGPNLHRKHAKLSEKEVQEIKNEFSTGLVTKARLAEKHGVSATTISQIVRGIGWEN